MHRNAVVVSNGKGQLWAQVAAGGEYVAWMITDQDASDMMTSITATVWETPSPWAQMWARLKVDSFMEVPFRRRKLK